MSAYDPIDEETDYPLIDTALVEAVAVRVTELLADQLQAPAVPVPPRPARRLTATEVSDWWGLRRGWVYQHATELGAIRIGDGERPRLRFDPDKVARYLEAQPQTPAPPAPCQQAIHGRRSRRMRADAPRLAFRADPELSSLHNDQEMAGRRANAPGRGAEDNGFGAMTSLPPTLQGTGPLRPARTLRRHQQRR